MAVLLYPARKAHDTRPLNAHGSLGNYLRQERPFGLGSAGRLPRDIGDRVDEGG